MEKANKYDSAMPLREKILYVLSTLEKASAGEVAAEIMELDGLAAEEEVADTTVDVEKQLDKLHEEGIVEKLREHRQKLRYVVKQG